MARRAGGILKPTDIDIPRVARDRGVQANFGAFNIPKRIDPRGRALEDLAQATGGVAEATRGLANTTRKGGTLVANAIEQIAQSQSGIAEATASGGQIVANAQEMFANSVAQLNDSFARLGRMRKEKQDQLAVEKWEFNRAKGTLDFEQNEVANPNPKKLEGKAYLSDVDARYAKFLDDNTTQTEDELGFSVSGDAKDKIAALSLRARVQAMESAANREHQRTVMAMYETAQQDAISSGQQVGSDGDIGAGIARGESIANRIQGVVSPEKYLAFKEATRKDAYAQGIRFHTNNAEKAAKNGNFAFAEIEIASAEAIVGQLTGLAGSNVDPTTSAIIDSFKAEGVDPLLGLAISYRETGGTFDPQSKTFINPKTGRRASSASGLFHMIDATALSLLGTVNAGSNTVENQAKAGARLTAGNIKGLRRFIGFEPTPGEVYLAHVLGLGQAVAVINADPDTPLANILPSNVIANSAPKLMGGTANDIRAWAQDAMQASMKTVVGSGLIEGRDVPKNLAGLPIDDAALLWKKVSDAKQGLIEEQEKRKKVGSFYEATLQFSNPVKLWDPTDADDKKRMNVLLGGDEGASKLLQRDQAFFNNSVLPLVTKTGMIPPNIKGAFQSMLRSSDMSTLTWSLKSLADLQTANPQAFARDMDSDTIKKVEIYRQWLSYKKPEEIVEAMQKYSNPEKSAAYQQMVKEGEDIADKTFVPHVAGYFNDTWFPWNNPAMPSEGTDVGELQLDAKRLFADTYAATGNEDVATTTAINLLRTRWGVTKVGGVERIMKRPPESFNPGGLDPKWMDAQARARLFPLVGDGDFMLQSDARTELEIKNGNTPTYQVMVPTPITKLMAGTIPSGYRIVRKK